MKIIVFKLRYYAPAEKVVFRHEDRYEEVLQLLESIKSKHGIDFEIFRIKSERIYDSLFVDEEHEKEIYEKHFKPRAKLLKYRLGQPIRLLLRSRRGHFHLAGTVAVVKDGNIEWFAPPWPNFFEEYDEDSSIAFLKAVLKNGRTLIEKLCEPIPPSKLETLILQKFMVLSPLKCRWETEVKVGKGIIVRDKYGKETKVAQKSIDAVCHTENEDWVLEVKPKLDYTSIGEVLAYSYLYKPIARKKVRMGIVCEKVDDELIEVCKSLEITVFQVNDKVKIYS